MKDLENRLFNFSIKTLTLLKKVKFSDVNKVIVNQLAKSSTSSGANYEEAQAGSSKSDFINKVNIALKEMRESNYWLRIIKSIEICPSEETEILLKESEELKKILATILIKSKQS
ncbi:MAG: four helix bundle protein [Ignavibacteriaceae bacterium]